MPPTVKLDRLRSSRQAKGLADIRHSSAVRAGRVEGLDNDNHDLGDAIAAAIAAANSDTHHNDTTLPLARVEAYKTALTKADVFLHYRWHEAADPTRPAWTHAEEHQSGMRRQWEYEIVEDAWSVTVGETTITHDRIRRKPRLVPIVTIMVKTVLDAHPGATPADYFGKVNDGVVPINGVDRAKHTLLSMGWRTRWIDTGDAVRWPTVYLFLWNPATWAHEWPYSSLQSYAVAGSTFPWYGQRWSVESALLSYQEATFYDESTGYVFPTHDSEGGGD